MVLVRYIERPEEKVGQIVIPGQTGAETTEAEILSVGPGTPDISTSDLHPGQRVLVRFRSGSGIQAPNKALSPVRETGVSVLFDGVSYKLHTSLDVVGILLPQAPKPAEQLGPK
jgi:co-chaperonin GroES (HSP10)